jgi:plastocyanin
MTLSLPPRLAVMVVGIAITACGSAGVSPSSTADAARASADATTSVPAVTAFGVGGKALGAPKLLVQMQYDAAQEYGLYVPATVSIAVGDIVEWDQVTLNDQEIHNVTFDADPSSLASSPATMRYGSVWQVRFSRPGTFTYLCTYHKLRMKGSVTVVR